MLGTAFEKISYEVKITASPDGGSVLKSTSKYFTIGEVNITEEEIKAGKEKADTMVKAIEASVVANPDACRADLIAIFYCSCSQYKTVKHKVEALDKNFTYSYSIMEGDALGTTLEKIRYEVQITASPEGGSVCKSTSKYFTIGEADITEEKIKAGKEKASAMFKAIEAYLLANPDAYRADLIAILSCSRYCIKYIWLW
ncbi:major allergen Pru ar 1-like [Eucalyptus grandis]|uniref:major allergen Pru ar 1-like n=1 Tax=Eucalyptus grandis TaxID=71139 RepID=UPI00192EA32D|nr:major allergen Pru ar 1-like [Eucalyptus grandis]